VQNSNLFVDFQSNTVMLDIVFGTKGKSWTPWSKRSWTKGWAWGGNRELWYWRVFSFLFENGRV